MFVFVPFKIGLTFIKNVFEFWLKHYCFSQLFSQKRVAVVSVFWGVCLFNSYKMQSQIIRVASHSTESKFQSFVTIVWVKLSKWSSSRTLALERPKMLMLSLQNIHWKIRINIKNNIQSQYTFLLLLLSLMSFFLNVN